MNTFLRLHRRGAGVIVALVAPALLAAFLSLFRASFAHVAAALVLVVAVLLAALVGTRVAGVVASVSAGLWFDFFLTPPFDRLAIDRRFDLETTVALLVVGVIVTELVARSRHLRRRSDEEANYIAMIQSLTEYTVHPTPRATVVATTEELISRLLCLRNCRFESESGDLPRARIAIDGEVVHVGLTWPTDDLGIPGPEAEIVAQWRGRSLGRFVLTPTPGEPVSLERRIVAVTLSRVAAAALSDSESMS